jgi:hypothetical protein
LSIPASNVGKKLNCRTVSLGVGQTICGKFVKRIETTNTSTGEAMDYVKFDELGGAGSFVMSLSTGLRQSLDTADVQPGQAIMIQRIDDFETRNGNKMHQYDIYEYQAG